MNKVMGYIVYSGHCTVCLPFLTICTTIKHYFCQCAFILLPSHTILDKNKFILYIQIVIKSILISAFLVLRECLDNMHSDYFHIGCLIMH